jgi:hypothetical protein
MTERGTHYFWSIGIICLGRNLPVTIRRPLLPSGATLEREGRRRELDRGRRLAPHLLPPTRVPDVSCQNTNRNTRRRSGMA